MNRISFIATAYCCDIWTICVQSFPNNNASVYRFFVFVFFFIYNIIILNYYFSPDLYVYIYILYDLTRRNTATVVFIQIDPYRQDIIKYHPSYYFCKTIIYSFFFLQDFVAIFTQNI